MRKKLAGLYAITNETLMPETHFLKMAEAALMGGVNILQYRDKSQNQKKRHQQAQALKQLCDKHSAIFIINDDIELAKEVDADGVHIGQHDSSFDEARQQLGKNKIIGVTCYNQMSIAQTAIRAGADYIAFGSFFGSSIKPDAPKADIHLITETKKKYNIPVCCIGGIDRENHSSLIEAGADMLAVISDIFSSTDSKGIQHRCEAFIFNPSLN